jgi:uncharacterized protein
MRKILLLSCLAVLLAGCGAPVTKPDTSTRAEAQRAAEAELEAGNYAGAASRFERLAEQSRGEQAQVYKLQAAEAYYRADVLEKSRGLLDTLNVDSGEQPDMFVRQRLLEAQLALAANEPELALARLEDARPSDSRPDLRTEYHLVRADAFTALGDEFASVAERLAADSTFRDNDQRLQQAKVLWQKLRRLERADLNRLQESTRDAAAGWVELAQIERAGLTDVTILRRTLDDWQLKYPRHPGAQLVLPELQQFTETLDRAPDQIALLLPFSTAYAEAATAIRDGFLAAWYQSRDSERPQIRIYDATELNIDNVYAQAVADGAGMIVGPLDKSSVTALIEKTDFNVPTLVLNHYDGNPERIAAINRERRVPRLYQFALAPEEEARQIAERAWYDGHARALSIAPASEWGRRVQHAFAEHFEALGGKILDHIPYEPAERDFLPSVRELLNISSSERRAEVLRNRLQRRLEVEPRRRQDADFIMLAGTSAVGRQIGPLLQYHQAADLPVYSTSHIFDGRIDERTDADMNGFIFADMPWLLDLSQKITPIYMSLQSHWPQRLAQNPRLFALGIDAYRILSELNALALQPAQRFDGVTGLLSVTESGRIHRQLQWARFVDGVPNPMDRDQVAGF